MLLCAESRARYNKSAGDNVGFVFVFQYVIEIMII